MKLGFLYRKNYNSRYHQYTNINYLFYSFYVGSLNYLLQIHFGVRVKLNLLRFKWSNVNYFRNFEKINNCKPQ